MRSARILGSLAAAALAVLLLLFWYQGSHGHVRSAAAPLDPPRAATASALELAPDLSRASEPSSRSTATAQRDALEAGATPGPTCLVRVVEAGSGTPLSAARLWIQREDVDWDDPEWWRVMRRFNDVEPVLASGLGHEFVLDQRGEVRVPRPARRLSVAAALGALHGDTILERSAETCVVELKPYHALTVEVVDRGGKPVPGAFVVLFWGEFDPLEDSTFLQTDEHGRLALAKLENQIYEHSDLGPVRVTLAGGVPCEPELVEFTLENVPREPVRFVAGDFASVVVQLTDPQGRELALEGTAFLEIATYKLEEPSLTLRAGAWPYQTLAAGRALFPVGLGFPLEIQCAAKGHDSEWREVAGPTTPGQELRVLIPLGERVAIARGRVRGTEGAGGIHCKAPLYLFHRWARVEDDGAFEFELPVSGELQRFAGPWDLKFEREGSPALGATVVPRLDAERMVIDFGEVVFEALSTLVRAKVVDDGGAPAAGARVEIQSASLLDGRGCDERGLVVLEGRAEELPVRVRATHETWLPSDWLEVTAPGTEATLALRRGASLEGRVLLPRGANLESCELNLSLAPSAERPALSEYCSPVEGGRFRFEACEPGFARLTVIYDDQTVVERTGIELVAGMTTQLPELDLRADLHPFTLTFELASGAPWLGGHFEVREPDGETSSWIVVGPSARAFLLFPRPSLELWVAGRGARPTLFEGVLDGDRLVLPSAPSIELRLAREIPLPTPPLALVVRGIRTKPEDVPFESDDDLDGADFVVGADGLVHLGVPWPGEYKLAWCVRHTGTGVEFDVEQDERQTVEVSDATADSLVPVRLAPDDVTRAVLAATGR